jgi:isopentenyldiphosphate isomerase
MLSPIADTRTQGPALKPAENDSELFDVVNELNVVVGSAARGVCHRDGLFHRATHVLLFRQPQSRAGKPELLLQRRSMRKRIGPGLLDLSCAEHVSAGESMLSAAVRSLGEELGLSIPAERLVEVHGPLLRKMVYNAAGVLDNEFVALYAAEYRSEQLDGKVMADRAEVSEVQWMNIGDVMELACSDALTPWFKDELVETDLENVAQRVLK